MNVVCMTLHIVGVANLSAVSMSFAVIVLQSQEDQNARMMR